MRNPDAPDSPVIRRSDYRAPGFLVDRVDLLFNLDTDSTLVESTLKLRRNPAANAETNLTLYGSGLTLQSVQLNGEALKASAYQVLNKPAHRIVIDAAVLESAGDSPTLSFITCFNPTANLALEGLYVTGDTFCTQCEAEGFRRITYFPDRPDVLSEYWVTIRADKTRFPVLLSNGNLVSERDLDDGRHEAVWHDPFKKPCYLFALVAGRIDRLQDHFVTASGRKVLLEIYSSKANLPRCVWAMNCLKAAMRWDEEAYGREYDLNRFMIYAADDFNMGAMENKGLNIFNSRFLLADQDTATDADFQLIDAIVGHEYFHNWSGNRVTCRDWFQISLKEGFTVFREQQYTASRSSPTVARIEEAAFMQSRQFAQDASPLAHPIRPDEYEAIDNFYTVTVYEKGAEVIRMLHTLLGAETFRKGTDLFFARHDGTAATCDDFVAAMEAASQQQLSQFKRWYSQAGTPTLVISDHFDAAAKRYTLNIQQQLPPTLGQPVKLPVVIPLSIALIAADGRVTHEQVLTSSEAQQSFVFKGIIGAGRKPIPSLLRGFSAPVRIEFNYSDADLVALCTRDTDGVVRWQALRTLFFRAFDSIQTSSNAAEALFDAVNQLLTDHATDPALIAQMLMFPACAELANRATIVDTMQLSDTREQLLAALVTSNRKTLVERYRSELSALAAAGGGYSQSSQAAAHRALASVLLQLANVVTNEAAQQLAQSAWHNANNLTDALAAMTALRDQPGPLRDALYKSFHDRWLDELSMLNRWFTLEASATRADALTRVETLLAHPKFDGKNPNRVRAVVQSFGDLNWRGFHALDGRGYAFMANQILRFDAQNPSLAARFCDAFSLWHKCADREKKQQRSQLERVAAHEALSPNVREVIEKTLKAGNSAGC